MRRVAIGAIVLLVGTSAYARDLSRQSFLIGEQAAGMGGAYTSMVGDPASSYYNPAGLGGLYNQAISLSASAYWMALEDYEGVVDHTTDAGERIIVDADSMTFSTFPASVVYLLPLDSHKDPEAFHHVLAFSLLVPQYDEVDAEVFMPRAASLPLEVKASFLIEAATYWAGPSYAFSVGGRFRAGVSLFVLTHLLEEQVKVSSKVAVEDDQGSWLDMYSAVSSERSAACVTALIQAGLQVDITDRFTLGFSVRSPTFGTLYSDVSVLSFNSWYMEGGRPNPTPLSGYVDRIETSDVEMEYRLPLMLALGAGYRVPDSWALALDVSFHLPTDPYRIFDGPLVYPKDAAGNPIPDANRALDPSTRTKSKWVFNANLGAEFNIAGDYRARLGFFTDLSSVDHNFYDANNLRGQAVILPSLNRFGASLGLAMIGDWSTSSFNLVYVLGVGETFALGEEIEGAEARMIDVTTHTITVVLAGTVDL